MYCSWLKTWKNVLFRKENIFFATETEAHSLILKQEAKSFRGHGIAELWYEKFYKIVFVHIYIYIWSWQKTLVLFMILLLNKPGL